MPMFDDPKEQLRRMQEQLLAAEEEEEEFDDLSDIDDLLEEYLDEAEYGKYSEEAEEHLPAYRNYANNYGRSHRARFVDTDEFEEEELDEDAVFYREDYRRGKKKQSNRGLMIIICLELIAIACVLGWWASWLL